MPETYEDVVQSFVSLFWPEVRPIPEWMGTTRKPSLEDYDGNGGED